MKYKKNKENKKNAVPKISYLLAREDKDVNRT